MIVIAEIGTSHAGSLKKAFELIDAAAFAEADCVKFQFVYADEILHPNTGFVELPGGKTRLYDTFKNLECPLDFYKQCLDYAHKKGLLFVCSPFGIKSFDELLSINPDAIKIASPEVNHFQLLNRCSNVYGKVPIILSSGVSKLGDIEKAIQIIKSKNESSNNLRLSPLTLLHCITSYPAPEEEYNVKCVQTLSNIFGLPIGISDHSLDPVLVPVLTTMLGGSMIEKHITLSKKTSGLDDPVALEPEQFALMVHSVKQTTSIIQKYQKEGMAINQDLKAQAQKEIYKQLEYSFSKEKIGLTLGNGIKKLAPSESQNYGRTNRSLHYLHDLKKGSKIKSNDIDSLRTEKILSPGISPEFLEILQGACLTKDVKSGDGVQWQDFMTF